MEPSVPPRPQFSEPALICAWCDRSDGLQALNNLWDFDPLPDAEPPAIVLCADCIVEAGIVASEPDACAEHRAGCPVGAHRRLLS